MRAAAFRHATAASLRIASTAPSERAPPVPAASATLGSVSDDSAEPSSPAKPELASQDLATALVRTGSGANGEAGVSEKAAAADTAAAPPDVSTPRGESRGTSELDSFSFYHGPETLQDVLPADMWRKSSSMSEARRSIFTEVHNRATV